MPLILDLSRQDDAVQARILSDQAVAIVRQYGPRAVLQATADALMYYLAQQQPDDPGSSREAYTDISDAIRECRRAVASLDRETYQHIARS